MKVPDFRQLFDRSALGYAYHEVVLDDSGKVCDYRFLDANAEFGKLTGLDYRAIIGKTVREVLPGTEHDPEDWIGKYGKLASEGGMFEFEGKSALLGKWFLVKAVSLKQGFFSTIVYDISCYKQVEALLSKNEERLRLLLENSNDWVMILDKNFNVVYSTKLGSRILGLAYGELASLDVFSVIHPEDLGKTYETIEWLNANPNKLAVIELRVQHTDGRYLWLEVFCSNLLDSLAVNGYVINARNVTDRKDADRALRESELHLRHITDNITDVVFLTDKELNTIYVSPSVLQMLGESPEVHMSKHLHEKHPPQSVAAMMDYFSEEIAHDADPNADPNRTRVIEVQHYRNDGSIIDVAMHVSMVRDETGAFNGLQGVTRDVSFQKRVERELKEKNSYIESLLSAIPDPIFVLNRSGKITDLKVGNFDGLYVPETQIPNQYLSDLMPQDLTDAVLARIELVLQEDKTLAFQYRLETQGVMRDFEARFSPLDENHVIALIRDITEQRNAIASIQQQNRFQKMVADLSTAFVKSQSSNIDVIMNRSLKRVGEFFDLQHSYIFRYSEDYSIMTKSNEWHASRTPAETPIQARYVTSTMPWLHSQIMSGNTINISDLEQLMPHAPIEYHILKNQNIRSMLCIPIQSGMRVFGFLGLDSMTGMRKFLDSEIANLQVIVNLLGEVLRKHDIEKKMQKQAKLQEILSHMAMKYINLPSRDLDVSITESLAELALFSKADRAYIFEYDWKNGICLNSNEWVADGIGGQTTLRKIVPIDMMSPWADLHKQGKTVVMEDISTAQIPDKLREILSNQDVKSMISLPLMEENRCVGFVGFDYTSGRQSVSESDITLLSLYAQLLVNVRNRKSLEDKLIFEKDRSEAANRAKSEFLANMSHEIRTPLNGVIGFTELLFNSGLDEAQHLYAQNIVNSSYNLLDIISDILDFSKIEAGKLELAPIKTDLIELMEHATDIIKVRTGQKGIELLLDVSPELPRYAILDPLRVNQILVNLLSNAEKFTQEGEVELKAFHRKTDADHADICFMIRDTGIGIDTAKKRRLFRAFSQLDSSTTRKYGGTGLGLVISNHLANLMNSKIDLSSEPGIGSTFSFCVNCRVEDEIQTLTKPVNIKKVMIVDDNEKSLRILEKIISFWDIEVLAFKSAQEAIRYAPDDPNIGLIMVDFGMPEMSGTETIRQIKKGLDDKSIDTTFILMHNAAEDPYLRNDSRDVNIRYRLIKPIIILKLQELLLSIDNQDFLHKPNKRNSVVKQYFPRQEFQHAPCILITEDNFLNMTLLKEMILQLMPQTVIMQASDGLQALEAVRQKEPDLILMDVQMPNLDGVSASREIRKFSEVPIIAITAGALKEEQDRCLAAGMNAFLTKPVLANELYETLISFLETRKKPALPAPQPKSDESGIRFNKDTLLKNLSGDTDTLANLIELVKNSFPNKLSDLQKALHLDDPKEAKSVLHSLKGSAQNMHFVTLGKLAAELEKDVERLDIAERSTRFEQISREWQEVLRVIS